jgi:hypothetical protein
VQGGVGGFFGTSFGYGASSAALGGGGGGGGEMAPITGASEASGPGWGTRQSHAISHNEVYILNNV